MRRQTVTPALFLDSVTDLHPPSTNPVKTMRTPDESPSVKLEGERILYPSSDIGATSIETNMSGALGHDEDAVGWPKKL